MPGSAGDLGRQYASVEGKSDPAMPQVIWSSCQRRYSLSVGQHGPPGALPDSGIDAFAEHRLAPAAEQQTTRRLAVPVAVFLEQNDPISGGIGTGLVAFLARCLRCRSS